MENAQLRTLIKCMKILSNSAVNLAKASEAQGLIIYMIKTLHEKEQAGDAFESLAQTFEECARIVRAVRMNLGLPDTTDMITEPSAFA